MRICGIELTGSEAVICLLDYSEGAFNVSDCRQRQFDVRQSASGQAIRDFQFAFSKLIEDYKIDQLAIIERPQKGKFAGSATSFKLEAALQLIDIPVNLIQAVQIKEQMKRNPLSVGPADLGLKKFQSQAFNVAYALHNAIIYHND